MIPCPESMGADTPQGDGHANPAPEVPEGSQAPQLCLNCWLTASQRALLCYPAMNYRINAICSSSSRLQNGTLKPRTLRGALGMWGSEVSLLQKPQGYASPQRGILPMPIRSLRWSKPKMTAVKITTKVQRPGVSHEPWLSLGSLCS